MPTVSRIKNQVVVDVDNWSLAALPSDPQGTIAISGFFHNHPKIPDGQVAISSGIIYYDKKTDLFSSFNTRYKLGTVNPKYDAIYPGAKEALIKSLSR